MEKYNFISEIMREECKDKNSRQCFGKLKEYTDKIVKSPLYSEIHKQMIAEILYSAYRYLNDRQRELITSWESYCILLQNRLKGINVINNKKESKCKRGKSQGKVIYIRDTVLADSNSQYEFIALFSHELAHIFSSGNSSIGLINKKRRMFGRNDGSGINIILKILQEMTLGSYHTYLNEMETDYLALRFINAYFGHIKQQFCYEFPTKEGLLLIKYEGTTYATISCFAKVINYILGNELEKSYLEDENSMMQLLKSPKYRYLKSALFEFERKNKKAASAKKGLYSKVYFDSYFRAYINLLRVYIQREALDDNQQKEFMELVKDVYITFDDKIYLEKMLKNLM